MRTLSRRAAFALVAACSLACAARPERAVLDQFFVGSKRGDRTALRQVATVIFEPKKDGVVEHFDITDVSPELDNTKTVTVSARVDLPDGGGSVRKTLILTLERAVVESDPQSHDRWMVTGFIAGTTPAAIARP